MLYIKMECHKHTSAEKGSVYRKLNHKKVVSGTESVSRALGSSQRSWLA